MYIHRSDASENLSVWILHSATGEDWDKHFGHIRDVATWSGAGKKRGAAVLVALDFSRPDVGRRAELARVTDAPDYNPWVAFINPSSAVRMLIAMLGWMQKAPRYEMSLFGKSTEALAWLSQKRGEPLDRLGVLLREAAEEYKTLSGSTIP